MNGALALFTGVAAAAVIAGCGASRAPTPAAHTAVGAGELITFGIHTCAPNWVLTAAGNEQFRVRDQSSREATVYLFESASGAVIATLRGLAPGGTRHLSVRLRGGATYSWGCYLKGYPEHLSDSEITSRAPLGTADSDLPQPPGSQIIPVYAADLIPPLRGYRGYVAAHLARLRGELAALTDATTLQTAQADWLRAHLTWLQIGQDDGAYGAFGELGERIDGSAGGLPGGTTNRNFTGFHRVELELWRHHNLAAAHAPSVTLQGLLARLMRTPLTDWLAASTAGLSSFVLRCHEVLEDALRDSMSGDDDYGSGSDLASLSADISATRELLTIFAPVLAPRAHALVGTARARLAVLSRAVDATHLHGRWIPVQELSTAARQRIDGALGAALETLAPASELLALGNAP